MGYYWYLVGEFGRNIKHSGRWLDWGKRRGSWR